jgi:hypothetical protein
MYLVIVSGYLCWDPIDPIFYRERASQPARMKRKRNGRRVESRRQASRCCLFTSYQGRHASPEAVLGAAHTPPPPPLHNSSAWLVMPPVSLLILRQPRPFRRSSSRATLKGAHLKEETKMNNFLLHSSLIRVLGAEQWAPKDRRKFPEDMRPRIFGLDADILTSRASTTAGTVRERVRK